MAVDINKAESTIRNILPDLVSLSGAINTKGEYLIFNSIVPNEVDIDDIDYVFKLYIAINSRIDDNSLAYEPISKTLTNLISDYKENRIVEIGRVKPYSVKGLIVYEITLTVKGFEYVDSH